MAQKKRPKVSSGAVLNRRARYDYELGDELQVGIVLTGPEARAARDGHVQLKGSYITIRNEELWLNNASFSIKLNKKGDPGAHSVDTRARKLLAKKHEIRALIAKKQRGSSIVPTRMLTSTNYIKLVIALGKGKKLYDKRETIKRRDQDRDAKRILKDY